MHVKLYRMSIDYWIANGLGRRRMVDLLGCYLYPFFVINSVVRLHFYILGVR